MNTPRKEENQSAKSLEGEIMSRIGEFSMEALMLDEQVEHTPWKQGAESTPGRKDIKSWCDHDCVRGRWVQWLALPNSEDLQGECGRSAQKGRIQMADEESGLLD